MIIFNLKLCKPLSKPYEFFSQKMFLSYRNIELFIFIKQI